MRGRRFCDCESKTDFGVKKSLQKVSKKVAPSQREATGYKPCGTCQTTGLSPKLVKLYARSLATMVGCEPRTATQLDLFHEGFISSIC